MRCQERFLPEHPKEFGWLPVADDGSVWSSERSLRLRSSGRPASNRVASSCVNARTSRLETRVNTEGSERFNDCDSVVVPEAITNRDISISLKFCHHNLFLTGLHTSFSDGPIEICGSVCEYRQRLFPDAGGASLGYPQHYSIPKPLKIINEFKYTHV